MQQISVEIIHILIPSITNINVTVYLQQLVGVIAVLIAVVVA